MTKPIAGMLLSVSLVGIAQAQGLRAGATPAEFPPASYTGNQYIDSKGCVYIRAGVDGAVTWVPRVTRERKLVCGYKPTGVAAASSAPKGNAQGVEQITLPPESAATATTTASAPPPKPKNAPLAELLGIPASTRTPSPAPPPTVFETTKSQPAAPTPTTKTAAPKTTSSSTSIFGTSARPPSPGPAPTTVYSQPQPAAAPAAKPAPAKPAPVPVAPAPRTVTAPAATTGCQGASALSQRYIRNDGRHPVRCGPQAESPVSRPGDQNSSLRVVPLHVYQQQAIARNLPVPEGYRPVWTDDRLNPHRAERTLAPPVVHAATVPPGYRPAWEDDRLNPMRATSTPTGEAQMATIWQDGVPRQVILPPAPSNRVLVSPKAQVQAPDTTTWFKRPLFSLSSTKAPTSQPTGTHTVAKAAVPGLAPQRPAQTRAQPSQTATTAKPAPSSAPVKRYVRVGAFASDADARAAAKALARASGLPMRLGTAKKGGKSYKVVLSGPFTDKASAQAALGKVRAAGYAGAKLNR